MSRRSSPTLRPAADAINTKNANLPALVALDTAEQRPYTVLDIKDELGHVAPPEPPFEPMSVSVQSATARTVAVCVITTDGPPVVRRTVSPM